ncbi:mechanosensitive ion channel domain-containing protein [uncultured Phocaeicola sp.]|uniref:mechanosensitive ion channel family protein n=1 Tax=uncultured Phocaeicola sp. TaxID=990718 RepID=UPI0025FF8F83|nr:mechanosensitive ion channel domain-containing protein [uncultured Phocaeicola sp.]
MEQINHSIAQFLLYIGIDEENINWSTQIFLIIGILLISYLTTKLFKHLIIPIVQKITARTKATWDDYLFNEKMMTSFCRMIPPIMYYILLPFAFKNTPLLLNILQKVCLIYLVVSCVRLVGAFLNSLYEISSEHEALKNRPLKGIYQMVNLVSIGVGIILIISILIDKDATTILAGLGASAAVLMLIFKDSILGLVAGVQLSANDMLRPGDWITMTKYGADGYVIEVSLTIVKVQNFDKTITTIPPYILVSDSFQNWRGMRESGGRRIKRSLYIDMSTIRFCTEEEIQHFIHKGWITEEEIKKEKETVNLYIFRRYIQQHIEHRPDINHNLMQLVRQMAPTTEGLPIEIYCFTNTSDWIPYESIQSDLFDHLIAITPEFGLRIFQRPAGTDIHPSQYTN